MNPKNQTQQNKRGRCVVCGDLTQFRVYVEGKLLPCHIDCLVVLRQRDQNLETAVVSSVV